MIIDYSTSRPPIPTLWSDGVTAVGRYIGWDSVPGYSSIGKNITKAEAEGLVTSGIQIFLAFEYTADAAAHGTSQGTKDGQLAKTQLSELGAPPSMAVYFAVDFDIPDYAPSLADIPANALAKLGPVGHYFEAINALKYAYEIGGYGGYWAIKRLLDAGLITKAWQTVAWSGGHIDPRAVLYQNASHSTISGADVDIHENSLTEPDFGQWPRPAKVTSPPAYPVPNVAVHGSLSFSVVLSNTGSPHYRVQVAADDNGNPGVIIPGGSVVVYQPHVTMNAPSHGTYFAKAQSAGDSPFSPWIKFTL